MQDPFLSKHDQFAHVGRMDRLTFSNQLRALHEFAYDQVIETTDQDGHELINLRIEAKNEVALKIADEIERVASDALRMDDETLRWTWNVVPDEVRKRN